MPDIGSMMPKSISRSVDIIPDVNPVCVAKVLPNGFVLPKIVNMSLSIHVQSVLNPHPDITYPSVFTEGVRDAAVEEIKRMEPICYPATPEMLVAWLWPIAHGVAHPYKGDLEDEVTLKATVLGRASRDIPYVAWTQDAQVSGLRKWHYMPSVAQIIEVVLPPVKPLIDRMRALRLIAGEA